MPDVKVTLTRKLWEKATVLLTVPENATHQDTLKAAALTADSLSLWEPDDEAHPRELSHFHSNVEVTS